MKFDEGSDSRLFSPDRQLGARVAEGEDCNHIILSYATYHTIGFCLY